MNIFGDGFYLNKILELNLKSNYRVFEKNKEWDKFEKFLSAFRKQRNTKSFFDILPFKLPKVGGVEYSVQVGDPEIIHTLGLKDIEFKKVESSKVEFTNILDTALDLFCNLTMQDNYSYIFIDELEAFYEESILFKRDLRMIRDLILTVKYFNDLFIENDFVKLKIICAVRTEVLESIKKNISAKEVNKVIYSFKKELKWNYSNTIAYQHPIIQIWFKRIKIAEEKHNQLCLTDAEVKNKWFSEKIDSVDIIPYILDNSWHKPRDVVRFLQAASNSSSDNTKYDQYVFSQLRKEYSKESWKEIFEELNVIYTPEQLELIRDFLTCFKRHFTFEEALSRAENISVQSQNKFLQENLIQILKDLYRVGCIGNMSVDKRYYRWQHKGDDSLVIDDSKLFLIIHSGLWNELSLFYVYQSSNQIYKFEKGQIVTCRVKGWNKSFVNVDILDSNMVGSIHISKLLNKRKFIRNIGSVINMGDIFQAKVLGEDPIHGLDLERHWVEEITSNRT